MAPLFLAWQPSCIVLVNDDVGPNCHFQGQGFPCGDCVARFCQKAVNACCGAVGCGGQMSNLDSCAGVDDTSACNALLSASGGAAGDLAACIGSSCPVCNLGGTPLDGGRGDTGTGGNTYCVQSGTSCECQILGTTNTVACDGTVVPNPLCCTTGSWPNAESSCSCYAYACNIQSDGSCLCAISNQGTGGATQCTPSAGQYCCADLSQSVCICSTNPCTSGQDPVSECSAAIGPCPSGETMASSTSCSM